MALGVALLALVWTGCSRTEWESLGPRPVAVVLAYYPGAVGLGQAYRVDADVLWGVGGTAVSSEHLDSTWVEWGPAPDYMQTMVYSVALSGSTHIYYPRAPDEVGVVYLRACAQVNGKLYVSPAVMIGAERGASAPGPPPGLNLPPAQPAPSAPPSWMPPPAPEPRCGVVQVSGGDLPDTRVIEMGRNFGAFQFTYVTYRIKDRLYVRYEGATIFDSGCVGTGGYVSAHIGYGGTATAITVEVQPNCEGEPGTLWAYEVGCPW